MEMNQKNHKEIIDFPLEGERIKRQNGRMQVSDKPIIPVIIGDGIGSDVTVTAMKVVDAAVEKIFGDKRKIIWFHIFAGEEAHKRYGEYLPEETIETIRQCLVAIKGPLTTPVGTGFRSLNVRLRQTLDLYVGVRPVKWLKGTPSPLKNPEKLDVVIFRENTEDVYAGIEWKQGTDEVKKVKEFLLEEMGVKIKDDASIGIKPISKSGTKRLVRAAINYALENERESITLMHKGNIMKFTEGAFRDWGYELAKEEYRDQIVTEQEVTEIHDGYKPEKKILFKDRIADSMFQQVLLRPDEYDIIATPNLNGDYISDACAAQVGGLGIAPGANINFEDGTAVFEATHGTAPKHANLDKANPSSMILSCAMMLKYIGWIDSKKLIIDGLEKTIQEKTVTYDLERQIEKATLLKCSEFGDAIISNM